VFVTHAPDLVRRICDDAVVLNRGRIHARGAPDQVVREFRALMLRDDLLYAGEEGTREIEIVSAALTREDGSSADVVTTGHGMILQVDLKAHRPVDDPVVAFALHDRNNQFVFGTNTDWRGWRFRPFEGKKRIRFHLRSMPLTDGQYWVTIGVHSRDASRTYHALEQRFTFGMERGEENPGRIFIPVDVDVEEL
jgi:hypothetical protein